MAGVRNIRDALKSIVPNWLANAPGLNTGFRVLFTIALICDLAVETLLQGIRAALPGLGDPSALTYVGRGRGILRGTQETDTAYAARLRRWLEIWETAGSAETLVQLVQLFLGGNPVVRLIDRSGNFVTANADGTTTTKVVDATWNWDETDVPANATHWSDMWLVIYDTTSRFPVYTSRSDPAFLAAWGTSEGFGYGHQVPRGIVDGIYLIITAFKSAHTWLQAIIWTTDNTLFVPGSLGVVPNGTYENNSHEIATNQVTARTVTTGGGSIRYWIPPFGG